MMNELVYDIEVLENALIAFEEGASDEKRAALFSLERLVKQKQALIDSYEKELAEDVCLKS